MFEKLQTGEKIQDSLEPAAIRFTFKCLQESARRSGYFLPAFFMYLYPQEIPVHFKENFGEN